MLIATAIITAALFISGCAAIAGKQHDPSVSPGLNLTFVESLRNQESLRGQSSGEPVGGMLGPPSLQRPGSVYADQFRVYVTDTAMPARVLIFDRGERTASDLNITSSSTSPEGKLLSPSGIAAASTGVIFVSDAQLGKVFGYDRNGALLMVVGRPQIVSRNGQGDLFYPSGLAIDNIRNRIYVADIKAYQVKVFDTMGMHLLDIEVSSGGSENYKFPSALALDRAGNVYVLDSRRLGVSVFTPEGTLIRSFSLKSKAIPVMSVKPNGIAVDSDGHVYVSDTVNNNVLIFTNDGSFIARWGRTGQLIGDFWTPTGIFIDSRDYIYIADQTNSRIQVFQYMK